MQTNGPSPRKVPALIVFGILLIAGSGVIGAGLALQNRGAAVQVNAFGHLWTVHLYTVLFVGALQAVLGRPRTARDRAVLVALAVGTAVATYLVFEHYLLVLLPRGAWTGF